MRVAIQIDLTDDICKQLEKLTRSPSSPVRLVERCRIILLAAKGWKDKDIASELSISRQKASRWRKRYAADGLAGIEQDAPRPGRIPTIPKRKVSEVITKTTTETPPGRTHWSTRTMAEATGLSRSTISRIWRANGLKPHLVKSFKVSNDPLFEEKLTEIVGIYLNPPEHALVYSVDEKSQIQALDRTQKSLPIYPGRCGTLTHDYKRNGTTTLFAAMNVADGTVIGKCSAGHKAEQWIRFLNQIDRSTDPDLDIHIICDNYCTHKGQRTKKWLERHKRFHLHFTPTSASWLNVIERFFRDLTTNRLKRGVFESVQALEAAIEEYLEIHNQKPKPYIWTAEARDILEKVKRARARLDRLRSA
jgi:transposase/transcriptional regulator with XRE-family HTH domain